MHLAPRDQALLALLDRTSATTAQICKASITFGDQPFRDERRARERLQALMQQQLVRTYSLGITGGGLANYYKLTPEGFRMVHGYEAELPHRSFFAELAPSRLLHTLELADVITHTLAAAHTHRIKLTGFHRENQLVLETGQHRISPDCHVQLTAAGRTFNVLFELDRSTEPLESEALSSIRRKLFAYEAYQDFAWGLWKQGGERGARPYFRVAFLTMTAERALHILALGREAAKNKNRRLCYAATLDSYLSDANAVQSPLFLDHSGHWQALVNVHFSAQFTREPVRIPPLAQRVLPL